MYIIILRIIFIGFIYGFIMWHLLRKTIQENYVDIKSSGLAFRHDKN